ncbi:MAG: hypothetical protein GTN78_21910 [Gemmatimonadales bacterium]|nr:hypothetical protein [Gemmatimonadales bacterium]NIN10584.1 hypothetical protein [Gemmatimonadales bacterium]NIR02824.1 hypothetical protein [Gemmatimonadales bacterium]NIS66416.1 hypothetical protein [Gemmatimonadales bacterium]
MGARDSGLCGDLYNGNADLSITEIELLVATYNQGDTTRRVYRHDAHDSPILPLTTTAYCVGILLNSREDFSWTIASAKGHAVQR